ncbi:MAG TPA: MFS transporter [Acidimicrobiales bacterium]|nr:MFS transporter [Acidimicrobiales bacterium]
MLIALCCVPNSSLVAYINVALPSIKETFGVSPATLSWAASAYITAGAAAAVACGRAADVLGLRRTMLACISGYAVASMAVASAPTFPLLVAARAVQGFCGMGLASLAIAATAHLFDPAERTRIMGLMLAVFGAGLIAASLAGGHLIEGVGWRWPFVGVGVLALGLLVGVAKLMPGVRVGERPPMDVAGGALALTGIVGSLIWINDLGRRPGGARALVALAVAVAAWAGFWSWIKRAPHPFLDPSLLRNGGYVAACGLGGAMQALYVGTGFLVPLVLHDVFGRRSGAIGQLMQPGFVALAAGGLLSRRLLARDPLRMVAGVSLAAGLVGVALAAVGVRGVFWYLLAAFGVFGGTYAVSQAGLTVVVARMLPEQYQATGLGFFAFFYFACGSLAVSATGGVASGHGFSSAFRVLGVLGVVVVVLAGAQLRRGLAVGRAARTGRAA